LEAKKKEEAEEKETLKGREQERENDSLKISQ
jgi:hypothetical protein